MTVVVGVGSGIWELVAWLKREIRTAGFGKGLLGKDSSNLEGMLAKGKTSS